MVCLILFKYQDLLNITYPPCINDHYIIDPHTHKLLLHNYSTLYTKYIFRSNWYVYSDETIITQKWFFVKSKQNCKSKRLWKRGCFFKEGIIFRFFLSLKEWRISNRNFFWRKVIMQINKQKPNKQNKLLIKIKIVKWK